MVKCVVRSGLHPTPDSANPAQIISPSSSLSPENTIAAEKFIKLGSAGAADLL